MEMFFYKMGISDIVEYITVNADDSVTIGAMVRHAEAERSTDVAAKAPLVRETMRQAKRVWLRQAHSVRDRLGCSGAFLKSDA